MTVYVLAQISIHDRDAYGRYVVGFLATLRPHQGRLLAADEQPALIQGEWLHDKVILIAFQNRDAAIGWMKSPEYLAISKDRVASTTGTVLLLQGIDG